jgi:predicted nucleotidyltransferase
MTQYKLPHHQIETFCRKWQIAEFALFGSVVYGNFRPDSDIDALVTFDPAAQWTLFDHVDMRMELETLFNRDVDLVSRQGIERSRNYIRRQEILDSAQVIYAIA